MEISNTKSSLHSDFRRKLRKKRELLPLKRLRKKRRKRLRSKEPTLVRPRNLKRRKRNPKKRRKRMKRHNNRRRSLPSPSSYGSILLVFMTSLTVSRKCTNMTSL